VSFVTRLQHIELLVSGLKRISKGIGYDIPYRKVDFHTVLICFTDSGN